MEQEPSGEYVGGYPETQLNEENSGDEEDSEQDEALTELIRRKLNAVEVEINYEPADIPQQTQNETKTTRVGSNGCVIPSGEKLIIPTKRVRSEEAVEVESNDE